MSYNLNMADTLIHQVVVNIDLREIQSITMKARITMANRDNI